MLQTNSYFQNKPTINVFLNIQFFFTSLILLLKWKVFVKFSVNLKLQNLTIVRKNAEKLNQKQMVVVIYVN